VKTQAKLDGAGDGYQADVIVLAEALGCVGEGSDGAGVSQSSATRSKPNNSPRVGSLEDAVGDDDKFFA
jgi:hypothetical protein